MTEWQILDEYTPGLSSRERATCGNGREEKWLGCLYGEKIPRGFLILECLVLLNT